MGNLFTVGHQKTRKILILGLDASGKTTILNRMKLELNLPEVPTVGYNCEVIKFKNRRYHVWDIGGQYELRQHWKHYFISTDALIMVIDSNDRERMSEAKVELHRILNHPGFGKVPVLIYANKQDFQGALTGKDVQEFLGLKKLKDRKWHVQASTAVAGVGVHEGMKWLAKNV